VAERIYVVTNKANGEVARYVRANSLNGAVRAHAREMFEAKAASTEQMFQAAKSGSLKVLDALKEDDDAAVKA
jgi:tellurite resistance protein